MSSARVRDRARGDAGIGFRHAARVPPIRTTVPDPRDGREILRKQFVDNGLRYFFGGRTFRVYPQGIRGGAEPAEPCPLIFCESAGFHLDALDGVVQRAAPFEVLDELLVPEPLARLSVEFACFPERAGFFEQPGFHHLFDAGVDPAIDGFGGPIEPDEQRVCAGLSGVPLGLELGDGRAGQAVDLQGADGTAEVVWVDSLASLFQCVTPLNLRPL